MRDISLESIIQFRLFSFFFDDGNVDDDHVAPSIPSEKSTLKGRSTGGQSTQPTHVGHLLDLSKCFFSGKFQIYDFSKPNKHFLAFLRSSKKPDLDPSKLD